MSHANSIIHSALWAAYGDALGYMTELADAAKVERRTGRSRVDRLQPWTRDLPGRPPKTVEFRTGTYSDDTQLRLATSRAVRADGRFDVAAFAKVELPTWTNYALGAGISSKEAAFSLSRASTQWFSNFFETKRANYRNGGGNGAAMRIQPHVWALAQDADIKIAIKDVIRNAVCTHGHPRGILGAVFHALCLHFTLSNSKLPNITDLQHIATRTEEGWNIILSDPDLKVFWVPQLAADKNSDVPPDQLFTDVVYELVNDVERLRMLGGPGAQVAYSDALKRLGLYDTASRGSGTKTALVAAWLAWQYEGRGVQAALVEAANALGSDTDTIGTMVGALMGAVADTAPHEQIQDADYIISEAERLSAVARRAAERSFGYPDLRAYKPPKSAVDAVYGDGGSYVMTGLGRAEPISPFLTTGDPTGDLRWLRLTHGQTVLAHIRQLPKAAASAGQSLFEPSRMSPAQTQRAPSALNQGATGVARPLSIDALASTVMASGFDPREIGAALLRLSDGPDEYYLERVASFSVIVGRAYRKSKRP